MGYYAIKFFPESYTLQEYTTCDRKISAASELVFKSQDKNCMKKTQSGTDNNNNNNKNIIVTTCTIVPPCMYVMKVAEVKQIPKSV